MCPYVKNHISPTTTNHEDIFCKSVRTHDWLHMVCDTWLYTILLMQYKRYSSRFVLTPKSVGTNLLSQRIRRKFKNHEDIWLPNHKEASTLRRGHPRWDVSLCLYPHGLDPKHVSYVVLHMVFIEFSTWFTCILHMFSIMSPICCATHALHTTVHMLLIMSTYASLHMVWMNSPHGWRGFSTSCCVV